MADRWKLGTYLAVQGVAAAGSYLLPDTAGAAVRLVVAAAATLVLAASIIVRRPPRPAGWWLVALSGALTYAAALAVVVGYGPGIGQQVASLSRLLLVVAALLALALGLAVLGWRTPGGTWDTLDTAIIATGAFLLVWVLFIDPRLASSASAFTTLIAVAVPAAALLTFGMAVRLALSGGAATWSGRLLLITTAAGLSTAGLVVGPIGAPTVPITEPIHASWLAESILVGAIGLAPDFDGWGVRPRPSRPGELPLSRLALFVVLALVAPLSVAIGFAQAGTPGPVLAAIIVPPLCGTTILLILVTRLALVAKVAAHRAEELGERTASLAAAIARQDELQAELAYRALHDPLTGLANRDVLAERIEAARDTSGDTERVSSRGQALLMVDLDGFKSINDTLGHPAGDQVLVTVSSRLTSVVPDAAVVTRLGGDEFAILLEDTPKDEARRAANAIREALREPYAVDGREVALTASVGLLVIKPGARRARYADGLRETDRALYAAKAAGGDRVVEAVSGQSPR